MTKVAKDKPARTYSTNRSTVKNNLLRQKATGENRVRMNDKNSDHKAQSTFWSKKFKPAVQYILDAATPAKRRDLEGALRKQSNNVAVEHRFKAKNHWTQKAAARAKDDALPMRRFFLQTQDRLFLLNDSFMPPNDTYTDTTIRVRVSPDGSLTEEQQPVDIPDHADNEWYDNNLFKISQASPAQYTQDMQIRDGSNAWIEIRGFWLDAMATATGKLAGLRIYHLEAYLLHMSSSGFRAYVDYFYNGAGEMVATNPSWQGRLQRATFVRLVYALGLKCNTLRRRARIDPISLLPIPPFWLLFTRTERIIMALVFQCQMAGRLQDHVIQLAKTSKALPLPRLFGNKTILSMVHKFPINAYTISEAEYLLTRLEKKGSLIPQDMTPYILLQDAGRALDLPEDMELDNADRISAIQDFSEEVD